MFMDLMVALQVTWTNYHVVVDDQDVGDGVAVGVDQVVIGTSVQDEPVALLLIEDGREAKGILTPRDVPAMTLVL